MLDFSGIAQRFFGSSNERRLRPMSKRVAEINALEDAFKAKSDEELRALTPAFRERLKEGATLEDLLPEAFAGFHMGQVDLKIYEWVGAKGHVKAHWQDITKSGLVIDGLANGASSSISLQVRVTSYKVNAPSVHGALLVFSRDLLPTQQSEPFQQLTVLR